MTYDRALIARAAPDDRDVLAYLFRKRGNALILAANSAASGDSRLYAEHAARFVGTLIDDLAGGLHHGEAAQVQEQS